MNCKNSLHFIEIINFDLLPDLCLLNPSLTIALLQLSKLFTFLPYSGPAKSAENRVGNPAVVQFLEYCLLSL